MLILRGRDERDLKDLHGEHKSLGSGSVRVNYAAEWEGRISGDSRSGSVSLRGPDIVLDESASSHVAAHKGDAGAGSLAVRTGSGSVSISVG